MKLLNKKLLTATVLSGVVASGAYAADQDIDATALFRAAVTFANETAMDFGSIDFGVSAGAVTFTLDAADGTITNSDTANYTAPATGTVGQVDFEGTTGQDVSVSCDTGGTLANVAGDNTITLDTTEININGGSDVACAGSGVSPTTFTLTSGTDQIFVGGRLNLAGAPNAEAYSTANTNGVPVTITVVY